MAQKKPIPSILKIRRGDDDMTLLYDEFDLSAALNEEEDLLDIEYESPPGDE